MKPGILRIYALIAGMLIMAGCSLDNPSPSPVANTLTLQVHQNLSLNTLSWNKVNVTGFKEYIILQSTSEIPATATPEINANVTVAKRIDEVGITTHVTSDIIFFPTICYKVFAAVDDRFIQSNNVCIEQDFTIINGFYDKGNHQNGLDESVLFDRANKRLAVLHLPSGEITNTVEEFNLNFPVIDVSTWNGSTNVFAYDQSPPRLRKYSYPNLNFNTSTVFSSILWAVEPYDKFVFVTVTESGKGFQVLNESNLNVLDTEPGLISMRNIAVFPGNPLTVLEIADNAINKYSIDDQGEITLLEQIQQGVFQPGLQSGTAINEDIFICGRLGEIINRNGENLGQLASSINAVITMARFSDDGKKVVYIISDNVSTRLETIDLSNPLIPVTLSSYDIAQTTYADLFIGNSIIYLIGVTFDSGQAQTFILKYPMPS